MSSQRISFSRELTKIFLIDFTSGAEAWLHEYEDASFEQQLVNIFDEIRPLYQQLHAYVRNKLSKKYGKDVVSERGPIPMHLLGNLWAQSWENVSTDKRLSSEPIFKETVDF